MNKPILFVLIVIFGLTLVYLLTQNNASTTPNTQITETDEVTLDENQEQIETPIDIQPISHATMVLQWDGVTLYTDPVGGAEAFANSPEPDIILVTDIHGDHLHVETLQSVATPDTTIIAPQAVVDELPATFTNPVIVLGNGQTSMHNDLSIEAVPMYNLPESEDSRHVKGRGNGYVIQKGDTRVYIAGDTAGTPEMRSLANIAIAFIPMNPPYTMDVEEAADAVLDFAPRIAYPYHYRTPEGFSDVERFAQLVEAGNPEITVVLLEWYPNTP